MSTTWVSNTSLARLPTSSYMACGSSSAARAAWTSFTMASSAARRFVSSNRRAFSSATLRLAASVVSRRTSVSENALVRSRFWSEMRPRSWPPEVSGARRTEREGSPWTGGDVSPRSASQREHVVDQHGLARFQQNL